MLQRSDYQQRIADILIHHGKIDPATLDEVLLDRYTAIDDDLLGEMLLSLGLITEEDLAKAIAEQKKLGYVDLAHVELDTDFQSECPVDVIESHLIYPLYTKDEVAFFAVHTLPERYLEGILQGLYNGKVTFLIASKKALFESIHNLIGSEVDAIEDRSSEFNSQHLEIKNLMEQHGMDGDIADPSTVIKFVDDLFYRAIIERASDIHIESTRLGIAIRFRIDGVLNQIMTLREELKNPIFSRIMILCGMDITRKSVPQDGRINASFGGPNLKMEGRSALIPGVWGPNINVRILKNIRLEHDLKVLGLSQANLKILQSHLKRKYGLILIGGPTGSGKSTSIYSCIEEVKTTENQVITIEDPVEVPLDGVIQMGVVENKIDGDRSVTFARGLRSILRMDPDVIVIGEIRDPETASIAISASLTGHLVISTVHAKNTIECLRRLMDLGVPAPDVVAAVNLLISQRLIRCICDLCKLVIELPVENRLLSLKFDGTSSRIYAGRGCSRCLGTGYYDRTGVFELLPVDEEIMNLGINGPEDLVKIQNLFTKKGIQTLNDDACMKVMHGISSLDEVTRILWEI